MGCIEATEAVEALFLSLHLSFLVNSLSRLSHLSSHTSLSLITALPY